MSLKYKTNMLPEWLQDELYQLNPEPGPNELIEVLLNDYIKRNGPKAEVEPPENLLNDVDGKIIPELDSLCAQYISDHPPHTPILELPVELHNKISDHYRPLMRHSDSYQKEMIKSFVFERSGPVLVRSYDGLYPRIRPTEY